MKIDEYRKECARYAEEARKAKGGDTDAVKEKAKAMNTIRLMEREAAKAGVIVRRPGTKLPGTTDGQPRRVLRQAEVVKETDTKRSLQEEYCRRFDGNRQVVINGQKTTLREHHTKRLLGR